MWEINFHQNCLSVGEKGYRCLFLCYERGQHSFSVGSGDSASSETDPLKENEGMQQLAGVLEVHHFMHVFSLERIHAMVGVILVSVAALHFLLIIGFTDGVTRNSAIHWHATIVIKLESTF